MSSINSNSGHYDNLNSSIVPIDANESFIGRYSSCLNYALIEVSVKTDSIYDIKCVYSADGVNDEFTNSQSVVAVSSDTLFYRFEPKMRYYRIQLNNTDINNQTFLSLQTLLKSTNIYLQSSPISNAVSIVQPLNMDGSVFVGGNLSLTGSVDANITNASLDVNVLNPVTSVDVNNFPATQDVNVTNPVTSVDVNNFPAEQDVNITNTLLDVSDADTHTKLDNIQTQLEKSNKGTSTLWSNNLTGVNGVSLTADLSNVNQSNLSIFGNVNGATQLIVQFSNDGSNFYDSQYSYTQSASGDYGFNINASPKYLRLKSTVSVTAYAFLNYC